MKTNKRIVLLIAVAALILIGAGVYYVSQEKEEKSNPDEVAAKTMDFINENLLAEGATASLVEITEESGIYKLKVNVGTTEAEVYVTEDARLLFIQGVIDMTPPTTTEEQVEAMTCETLPKTEKPILQAFVVSGCPYGLQMQRILSEIIKNIPSLAENIRVEYIGAIVDGQITSMHGEAEAQENLRQICIREEQGSKYWDYVSCFMKEGKSADCLTEANIDTATLDGCMTDSNKGIKYAAVDFAMQNQYGVSGSPTLFLNGNKVSEFDFGGRTAEAVKTVICCGANEQPADCSQTLSTGSAATSFSETYSASGTSNNSASCQ